MDKRPIGIFDSGVGGLTVVKQVIKELPKENIIYLGDTARIPYGTRDSKTIKGFAQELTKFIKNQDVKLIIVACNTMSAVSLTEIKNVADKIPVVDVISPTVDYLSKINELETVAVIGTRATINSGAYEKQIKSQPQIKTIVKSCPLFVPLVEEGFIKGKIVEFLAEDYLSEIIHKNVEALVLGCTHYPVLEPVIRKTIGNQIKIIDSGFPTALRVKEILVENKILNLSNKTTKYKFYVTDNTIRSFEIADRLFDGKFPGKIEKIIID